MDLREVFATNLRRLRHDKGLSQDDLAYEAEVSRSYLSQLEKGTYYASLKIVGRLAQALSVEPAELLKSPHPREVRLHSDRAAFARMTTNCADIVCLRGTPGPDDRQDSSRAMGCDRHGFCKFQLS